MKIDERQLVQKVKKQMRSLIEDHRLGEIVSIQEEELLSKGDSYTRPDLVVTIRLKNGEQCKFIIEVKSVGEPRYIRAAINQVQSYISDQENEYGMIAAPFLTENTMNLSSAHDIGCIDLAGNCSIDFKNYFIKIKGNENSYSNKRSLKALFSPKTTRILRVILCDPQKSWKVSELAKEADVSLGQAANVKKKLLDEEFVTQTADKKIKMINAERLLNEWVKNYSYRKNDIKNYYSMNSTEHIEEQIQQYFSSDQRRYAFTLTTGADIVKPYLRYKRVFLYLEFETIVDIAKRLQWKEVASGPNITILEPYDSGIFYRMQNIQNKNVVCDIQLYLDLMSYKERGEEAAQKILEERIKPKW
ncbi:MAG: hypothetical protein K8I00_06785 [Candidatus Omnitrophica bacterium]|nr:hypothetical protein [Candidatus Omnitrophota bacterium]